MEEKIDLKCTMGKVDGHNLLVKLKGIFLNLLYLLTGLDFLRTIELNYHACLCIVDPKLEEITNQPREFGSFDGPLLDDDQVSAKVRGSLFVFVYDHICVVVWLWRDFVKAGLLIYVCLFFYICRQVPVKLLVFFAISFEGVPKSISGVVKLPLLVRIPVIPKVYLNELHSLEGMGVV